MVPSLFGPQLIPNPSPSTCIMQLDQKYEKYISLQAQSDLVEKYIKIEEVEMVLNKVAWIYRQSKITHVFECSKGYSSFTYGFVVAGISIPFIF
jgi:hypothetical protein